MQSGNETNDSLKSGPAKAGPAGGVTPPLYSYAALLPKGWDILAGFEPANMVA